MDPRIRRIAFVTGHYGALRDGVSRAIFAACLLGLWVQELLDGPFLSHFRTARLLLAIGSLFGIAAIAVVLWIVAGRWMDRRFGRVRLRRRFPPWELSIGWWGYLAAQHLDETYGVGASRPALAFMAIAAYAIWLVVKLRPYGFHNLVPAAVSLSFAFAFVNVRDEAAYEIWYFNAISATLVAWIAAGLIDLSLLFRVLPDRRGEEVDADAS